MELQAKDVSEQAKDALAEMQSSQSSVGPSNSAIDEITSVTETTVSFTNTWDPLLKKIELFTKIVDGIAEVRHKCDWLDMAYSDFNFMERFTLMPKWHGQFCLRPTKCVLIAY